MDLVDRSRSVSCDWWLSALIGQEHACQIIRIAFNAGDEQPNGASLREALPQNSLHCFEVRSRRQHVVKDEQRIISWR